MNYQKIYDALIARSKCRERPEFVERHHIVPKCMGGVDEDSNLADLTPEEHFLAHQLLVKIHRGHPGLVHAALLMTTSSNGQRVSNKLYGWLKRRYKSFKLFYITDGNVDKKLLEGEPIPEGFRKGRSNGMKGITDLPKSHYESMGKLGAKALIEKRKDKEFDSKFRDKFSKPRSEETKKKISSTMKGRKKKSG